MGRGENQGVQSLTRFEDEAIPMYKDVLGNVQMIPELTSQEFALLSDPDHRQQVRELIHSLDTNDTQRAAVITSMRELAQLISHKAK